MPQLPTLCVAFLRHLKTRSLIISERYPLWHVKLCPFWQSGVTSRTQLLAQAWKGTRGRPLSQLGRVLSLTAIAKHIVQRASSAAPSFAHLLLLRNEEHALHPSVLFSSCNPMPKPFRLRCGTSLLSQGCHDVIYQHRRLDGNVQESVYLFQCPV